MTTKEKQKPGTNSKNDINLNYFIKFYAIPILSMIVLMAIVFFAIIPNIKQSSQLFSKINELENENLIVQSRIDNLTAIRSQNNTRQELIDKINELVPTGKSQVVKFRQRINSSGTGNDLEIKDSKAGETINYTIVTIDNFSLIQIPSQFIVEGKFKNMRSFLNALYEGQDFFIVNQMGLNLAGVESGEDKWLGEFDLTKYQFFAEDEFNSINVFSNVSESQQPNQQVIDFLEQRFLIK